MLNSIQTQQLFDQIATIEKRASNLQAMVQGAPIDSVRIGTAIITTAKIADGTIQTANIVDGAVTNAKINSLSAVKVTAGSINADRIGANSITAEKLNVSTLSAISADFGTLTAGSVDSITITGSPVRTSSGGDRVSLSDANLFLRSGGSVRITFQPSVAGGFVNEGGIGFYELGSTSESGSFRGIAGVSGGSGFIMGSTNVPLILLQTLGNGSMLVETVSGDVHFNCNTFQINGSTKTAIVPTQNGYNALYCVEAPEVWFFDIVEHGQIDPLFLEVTEGEIKTVTNEIGQKLVFRKRKGFASFRFTKKTKQQFLQNNKLWQN